MAEPSGRERGDDSKPRDLRALVQDMTQWRQAPVAGTNLIAVSVSAALPENKRTQELLDQMLSGLSAIAQRVRGKFYRATPGDLELVVRVVLPSADDPRARRLYEQMAKELADFDARAAARPGA